MQCSVLAIILVHFLIYALSSPDGFLFVPSAHILSLFVFLLLLVLYLYQADMCFFWFCFCISSLDGFLFVPSRHMFLLILFFVLLADKAKTKKSQGWYRLVHPLVVWGKLHGPPLLLLQSARKPPDEGAGAPQGPAHLFQCTEQDQREDILNMMISTEDRVPYLLKCGLWSWNEVCTQVIEQSVSSLTNRRRSLLEPKSESTLRTHY